MDLKDIPVSQTAWANVNDFVNQIAPIIVSNVIEYAQADKRWIAPSVMIYQAARESGWNINSSTLFGIKKQGGAGKYTTEYVNGEPVKVWAEFSTYDSIDEAVKQYLDMMNVKSWYFDATNTLDVVAVAYGLQHDEGSHDDLIYATDPAYEQAIIEGVAKYDLAQYDEYFRRKLDNSNDSDNIVSVLKCIQEQIDTLINLLGG